ncbi:mitochondria-eating protein-like isoform X2 [Pomacea canaliculata]|uniref:mitochondria-eating protein-like isoform X2 n=1 Tax=Pomacea canaliculata TaxID=400727 RepID=UPI000D72F8F6|nr:mitochondria-eating protein-like isoform X2 [Pomacea canaliculata]
MAESLRRLVNIGTFSVLQEKLEKWLSDYYINSCDQNTARCCEIIELNAKVQGQLFKLLSLCAQEGGLYGGTNIIKSRLLPWLGQNFFTSGGALTADTSLSVLAEASAKERELNEMQTIYEKSLDELEVELRSTQAECQNLKDELQETKIELDRSLRSSTSDKMFTELEFNDLRRKLAEAEEENKALRAKAGLLNDYQSEVRRLREDIALLTTRRDVLSSMSRSPPQSPALSIKKTELAYSNGLREAQEEISRLRIRCGLVDDYERKIQNLRDELYLSSSVKPRPVLDTSTYRYKPGLSSPLSIDDPVQRIRQQNYIARFNDMFAQDRLDAMDTLRRFSDDHENNQRIIFAAISEAFSAAKMEFRQFKMKTRANLAKTHYGPETLEEAVQDYINRNTDLVDVPGLVSDVIRALNRNPKIFLPPDTTYAIIQPFIREAVKLAWQMSSLAHPLDIAVASDAELFDDSKYRRSYDSEYTAPLVNHHIWPCLMQGIRVLVKGEAHTRRGASLSSPTRGRSPTRSLSPGLRSFSPARSRSVSPSRFARSRSPSPLRRSFSPRRVI